MSYSPLVSVIIPTYNRAHLIGETLDSVLAQTYSAWECIVVDDGSTDGTAALLDAYCAKDPRIQYYQRPEDRPKGANACRNYGFEVSTGDYVNWFDSDDLMHQRKLELQINQLKDATFPFSVCQTLVFENDITNVSGLRHDTIISEHPFEDYLTGKIIWLTQAPLWRKDFLKTMEYLFDERLQAAQEWEFHSRVLYFCKLYGTVDEPLVYIRKHTDSITYKKDVSNTIYHYFLARFKIYSNKVLSINTTAQQSLRKIMFNLFKDMIVKRYFVKSFKLYRLLASGGLNFKLSNRIYAVLSIFSFKLFGRGYAFLDKID